MPLETGHLHWVNTAPADGLGLPELTTSAPGQQQTSRWPGTTWNQGIRARWALHPLRPSTMCTIYHISRTMRQPQWVNFINSSESWAQKHTFLLAQYTQNSNYFTDGQLRPNPNNTSQNCIWCQLILSSISATRNDTVWWPFCISSDG